MIKYYLLPAEIIEENGEPLRRPKYLDDLKLNWAGIYIEEKDVFVVIVNESKDLKKITEVEKKVDILNLDGKRKTKDDLKSKLNLLNTIGDSEDEVEIIARLQQPDFKKDNIWVSD